MNRIMRHLPEILMTLLVAGAATAYFWAIRSEVRADAVCQELGYGTGDQIIGHGIVCYGVLIETNEDTT